MARARDFLRMGIGIRDRYERCREWWEPHLRCTKEFVSRSVVPADSIAVLGAGRLLDIELQILLESFAHVTLIDADPSCRSDWKRIAGRDFGERVTGEIADLTEVLQGWSGPLGREAASVDLAGYLRELKAPMPSWSYRRFDAVISLNLLGQIPLYWRDRVLSVKPELTDEEWGALQSSMGRLQAAHLSGLQALKAAQTFIITDTEYYFYHVDRSEWAVQEALYGQGRICSRVSLTQPPFTQTTPGCGIWPRNSWSLTRRARFTK